MTSEDGVVDEGPLYLRCFLQRLLMRCYILEDGERYCDGGSEGWSYIGVYGFREREAGFRILDR